MRFNSGQEVLATVASRLRWMVLLATAAVGLGSAACGSSSAPGSAGTSSTRTTPAPTTVTTGVVGCSAAGQSRTLRADPGLPAAVATMRSDLARAAASCDWAALSVLADRNGRGLRFSFGAETDPVAYWKAEEQRSGAVPPMKALRLLLGLPHARQTAPDGTTSYIWPAAFASEHPTQAELEEVAGTGLYSMSTLNGWVQGGNNYLGYRVIITGTGDWTLFVAGD